MGTISDKLMRIINTKEDIRQALISKGYDVPTSIPFKEYAKMISDLPCRVDSFPDIEGIVARYSALGLTNEQMAANPVWVDKTGNGHDIQLKNFSWKGMSGVGGYVQDFNYFRNNVVKTYPWLFPDQAWTVVGKTNEDEDRATIANITGNGNDLVLSNFGFAEGSGYNEEGEYAGYLVTDGVDDKIISSIFKMGNDWTVIGDWELINTGKNDNAGIVKFDSIVIYNYNYNSVLINIKNGRNILIPDQNTVNAICSDGRIYSKDWKESIYNEETESTSKNFLTIGYSGNAYTKIAFKNLAIYPTVLSREDCIKAYNYLQTLKAK